ncbi:MAG: DUF2294 domain-containing protein [Oscillospiraceae bacterium]|nr:DUF2294 domain-containing protein [Oscillospiraceae bacterium]
MQRGRCSLLHRNKAKTQGIPLISLCPCCLRLSGKLTALQEGVVRVSLSVGEFKQEILKTYNAVNKGIFHGGVRQQNVEMDGNRIIILSKNSRAPVLKTLDSRAPDITSYLDYLLAQIFKERIRAEMEERFQLNITAIFKDYDAMTETSGTVIYLERDFQSYLNELPEIPR